MFSLVEIIVSVMRSQVFFPVRHQLMTLLMTTLTKLCANQGNIDNRRLAVELCEMIIKWELYRLKHCSETGTMQVNKGVKSLANHSNTDCQRPGNRRRVAILTSASHATIRT